MVSDKTKYEYLYYELTNQSEFFTYFFFLMQEKNQICCLQICDMQ